MLYIVITHIQELKNISVNKMAHTHQEKFDHPSLFFRWGFKLANLVQGRTYYKSLVDQLNLKGNESILEFGCGFGFLAERLAKELNKTGNLTLIDLSEYLVEYTGKKIKKYQDKTNIELLSGDIRDLVLKENFYDFVVSTWVLHHLEPKTLEESISKLVSSLKSKGKFFIIEFGDSHADHSDIREADLVTLFEKFGFRSKIIFNKNHGIFYEFSRYKER